MYDHDSEEERRQRKRWGKIYAVGIPVAGLFFWLFYGVNPGLVLLGVGFFELVTFFYVIGWIRPTGGGGDPGG